jgi:hypothetical protein
MSALRVAILTVATAAACAASAPTRGGGAMLPREPLSQIANEAMDASPDGAAMPSGAALDAMPPHSPAEVEPSDASTRPSGPVAEAPLPSSACNEQPPQDFLVRGNFLKEGPGGNLRAIQYRTEQYGYFGGFGRPGPDARPPTTYVVETTFMGLPVKMHRRVVPALGCVEHEIRRACADHPYTPHALAGIRTRNTYRGGEVTNHAYGIAIDVDPGQNTCCGCVKPWNDAPACKRPAKTEYDRMAMPECWVHAFERFGFYWLGHDVLRDTMHFEFLGDPEHILTPAPRSSPAQGSAPRSDAGISM